MNPPRVSWFRLSQSTFALLPVLAILGGLILSGCGRFPFGGSPDERDVIVLNDADDEEPDRETDTLPVDTLHPVVETDTARVPVVAPARRQLNAALLLPFSLDARALDRLRNRDTNKRNPRLIALDLYEGALLAADTLAALGMVVHLHAFDTRNSTAEVRRILRRPEFDTMDLVIGPVLQGNLTEAARSSRDRDYFLVSPFSSNREAMKGHSRSYMAATSQDEQFLAMAEHVERNWPYAKRILLMRNHPEEKAAAELLLGLLQDSLGGRAVEVMELDFKLDGLLDSLSLVRPNVVIVPSSDEIFVNAVTRSLSSRADEVEVIVYGMSSWRHFESISLDYLGRIGYHFATGYWVDQHSALAQSFGERYRERFGAPPTEFAYRGYDLLLGFGDWLHRYGDDFPRYTSLGMDNRRVFFPFRFPSEGTLSDSLGQCRSNAHVKIIRYRDFEFVPTDSSPRTPR